MCSASHCGPDVTARDRVADDEHVGATVGLIRSVAFYEIDPGFGELCAHRRIHVGVATAHGMAGRSCEKRNASHEGTADTEDVKVHGASPTLPAPGPV
jgi:hypothetical protein